MSDEWDLRKLTAAREAHRRDRSGNRPESYDTWADWWTEMYGAGETFAQYVERRRRMNGNDEVPDQSGQPGQGSAGD